MIDLWTAAQWLEDSVKDWQFVWTSPDVLPWLTSMVLILTLSIVWPVMRRRKQAAAMEWRKTLAARARA